MADDEVHVESRACTPFSGHETNSFEMSHAGVAPRHICRPLLNCQFDNYHYFGCEAARCLRNILYRKRRV